MAALPPARIEVECDNCGEIREMDMTESASQPWGWALDESTIDDSGWIGNASKCYCSQECKDESEKETDRG